MTKVNEQKLSREPSATVESYIRELARNPVGYKGELSKEDVAEVAERMTLSVETATCARILEVMEHKKLLERNRDAKHHRPHYVVSWRNQNEFADEFEERGRFKTKEDAQQFIDYQLADPRFDEWRVEKVE